MAARRTNKEILGIYLPRDLKREAKKKAIDEGCSLSRVVDGLLTGWVKGEIDYCVSEKRMERRNKKNNSVPVAR